MKKLLLVCNDKIWFSNQKYTSNNDLNNIITCLNEKYDLNLICRKSNKQLKFRLDNRFTFQRLDKIIEKNLNFLMISITPYNFMIFFYLVFIKKINIKGFVYLRSDGFLEYKYRFGYIGYYFYSLMFNVIKKKLKIISCSKNFTKVNVEKVVHPSELDNNWLNQSNLYSNKKNDFLYVGRFTKDKGAHYIANIFKKYLHNFKLTIVGNDKYIVPNKFYSSNIEYKGSISDVKKLIELYDSSKIFILPSYIEGFPKVISESLSRLTPIIIFEEIKYVISNRKGIFACKRNYKSLLVTINYILKNYDEIQNDIKKNYFYTKDNFKKELLEFVKDEFE